MGANWWLYVWGAWVAFNLLLLFILPIAHRAAVQQVSADGRRQLKARIEALLKKCGFTASGLFVMDGSKRSSHGNAYFTGFGKTKRIVFFDTLLARLTPAKSRRCWRTNWGISSATTWSSASRLSFVMSLGFLWLLAQLMQADWFYSRAGRNTAHNQFVHRTGALAVLPGAAGIQLPAASAHLGLFAQA